MDSWIVFAGWCALGGALGVVAFGVVRVPLWARVLAALELPVLAVVVVVVAGWGGEALASGGKGGAMAWYLAGVAGSLWMAIESKARAWWRARKKTEA